jgi:hypothetical protein
MSESRESHSCKLGQRVGGLPSLFDRKDEKGLLFAMRREEVPRKLKILETQDNFKIRHFYYFANTIAQLCPPLL